MTGDETPHVALVTGGARGIGKAIAQRLAAHGMKVLVTARSLHRGVGSYAGSLDEVVGEIRAAGGEAIGCAVDLSDPTYDRGALLRTAEDSFGAPVDIVVHNAAATRRFETTFPHMTEAAFRESVEVNVWAGWDLAVKAYPGMRHRGAGWILYLSSAQAAPRIGPPFRLNPTNGATLYGSTKAMIDRLVTGAASELFDDNIAINTLAPESAVATDHALAVSNGAVTAAAAEPVETVAEAALALCTGNPRLLTGQVTYSLSLLVGLERPVFGLDGTTPLQGWQPHEIARDRLRAHYLSYR
jgi:citronellol/citronellal dehydrogenase